MASVMAIRKSAIPSLPENVRAYVKEFFADRRILGIECMVAQKHCYHPAASSYARWGDGMAPSHSVDLARFGKTPEGLSVNDVLYKLVKERPEDVMEVHTTERSRPSDYDD